MKLNNYGKRTITKEELTNAFFFLEIESLQSGKDLRYYNENG